MRTWILPRWPIVNVRYSGAIESGTGFLVTDCVFIDRLRARDHMNGRLTTRSGFYAHGEHKGGTTAELLSGWFKAATVERR